jgi:hypothetical protein
MGQKGSFFMRLGDERPHDARALFLSDCEGCWENGGLFGACIYGKHLVIGGPNNRVMVSGNLFQSQIAARYRGFSGFSSQAFSPEGVQ